MSTYIVARNANGPLHIADPKSGHAICGMPLDFGNPKVEKWVKGRLALVAWHANPHCRSCEALDAEWRAA